MDQGPGPLTNFIALSLRTRIVRSLPLVAIGIGAFLTRYVLIQTVRTECDDATYVIGGCYRYGSDAEYVGTQADFLVEGYGFVSPAVHPLGKTPGAAHPPLHTIFIAGLELFGLYDVWQWRIATSVVGGIGVLLIGLAATEAAGNRSRAVGLIAATIAALNPLLWIKDTDLLAESLLIPAIATVILLCYRFRRSPSIRTAAFLGMAIGFAWLIRSEQILLLPLLAPLFIRGPAETPLRQRMGFFAVAALVPVVMMTPWVLYNLGRFNNPVFISTNSGVTLRMGNCDDVYHGTNIGYYSWGCLNTTFIRNWDESDYDRFQQRQAINYIRDNASHFPFMMLARAGRLWKLYKPIDTMNKEAVLEDHGFFAAKTGLVAIYTLSALAIPGAVLLKRRSRPISPLLGPVLLSTLTAALATPVPRYRTAADVAVVILAAITLHWCASHLRRLSGALQHSMRE
ncbi:MAG: glycosyltransferase family 39 protein [Acidimicrobiales bacterium]|nr:glycosyltransferase family 39 protein [Acidimicrobiales bacterium]